MAIAPYDYPQHQNLSREELLGGSQLPKPKLGTMLLSVSYLSTINMNFIILFFLEHFQYIIYFHSRYTSQYTVPYNSLAVHNVFFYPHPVHILFKQQGITLPALVLELIPAG